MAKGAKNETEISILKLNQGVLNVCIKGVSPLIYNAMSEKARHELLMPAPKKNAAEKAANLKHDPFAEYRNSTYQNRGDAEPTRLSTRGSYGHHIIGRAAPEGSKCSTRHR